MQAAGEPDQVISGHLGDKCRAVSWLEPDGNYVRVVNGSFVPAAQPARGQLLWLVRELAMTKDQSS